MAKNQLMKLALFQSLHAIAVIDILAIDKVDGEGDGQVWKFSNDH